MRRRDSGDMANAIGETRAVARQGSSQHDEMDGCARWWVWMGISGRGCRQDRRGLHLHATALSALYLDWLEPARQETRAGGLGSPGSVLALASSHKGKSWGGHTLISTTKPSLGRRGVDIGGQVRSNQGKKARKVRQGLFVALFGARSLLGPSPLSFSRDWLAHSRSVGPDRWTRVFLLTVAGPPFPYSMDAGIVGTVARDGNTQTETQAGTGRHKRGSGPR